MSTALITDEMRDRQRQLLQKLCEQHPTAIVEVEWDFDSLFTPTPKMKYRIVEKE